MSVEPITGKPLNVVTCSSCKVIEKVTVKPVEPIEMHPNKAPIGHTTPRSTERPYDVVSSKDAEQSFENFSNPIKSTNLVLPTVNTPTVTASESPAQPTPQAKRIASMMPKVSAKLVQEIRPLIKSERLVQIAAQTPQLATTTVPELTTEFTINNDRPIRPIAQLMPPPNNNLQMNPLLKAETPSAVTKSQPQPIVVSTPSLLKAMNEFLNDLVYKFNYSTTFHGHNEEGDRNGYKKGAYFSIGRDNIKRTVEYVANENGFVPHVKYEIVSSAEAPTVLTDKSGVLKGVEFKWFKTSA